MEKAVRFVEEIIKIIKEFVDENSLEDTEYQKKVGEILNDNKILLIDSEMLNFDSSKYLCLIEYENEGDVKDLDNFLNNIKTRRNEKKDYAEYEFIVVVRSISNKILLEEKVNKMWKIKRTTIKIAFISKQNDENFIINTKSNIQNLEYFADNKHIASIFTAKLYDLVELYNIKGDALFSDNVRFHVKDKLDVDEKIVRTLEEEPDKFWLYNNGITLLVDKACIDIKKQRKIRIISSYSDKTSVINGAQTISVASNFFYSKKNEEKKIEKAKDDAYVALRVVFYDKNEDDLYSKISLSLNRQKAITEANIRYSDDLVKDINKLYDERKMESCFYIAKDGEELTHDSVDLSAFAKIAAIYLLQMPGTARNAKGEIIKSDKYWDKLKLIWDEEEEVANSFMMKYKPFLYVHSLFNKLSAKMKEKKNSEDRTLANWCKYGTEFFVAYIIWQMNGKNNDDFSKFEASDLSKDNDRILDNIINSFVNYAKQYSVGKDIDSNFTKNDSEYEKFRKFLDENGVELAANICKLNNKIYNTFACIL